MHFVACTSDLAHTLVCMHAVIINFINLTQKGGIPDDAMHACIQEALFKSILPDFYIDWEYVKAQNSSFNGKKNILGDAHTWINLLHFVDFAECNIPDRLLQTQHPPLFCLHSAILSAGWRARVYVFMQSCVSV